MKLKNILYIFLSLIISIAAVNVVEANAAKKTKSRTTQTSKSKTSKSSKKSRNSRSTKKRTTKKRNTSRRSVKKDTTPPPETPSNDSLTLHINQALLDWIPSNLNPGGLRVNKVTPDSALRIAKVSLNENFTYLPVTRELIDSIRNHVELSLPDSLANYRVTLNVGQRGLAYYITKVDKLPEKFRINIPFVTKAIPSIHPTKGMENDIIAVWHSHGRYFGSGGWMWQRPLLFQSVEDTYTMSYILPFLVPMLENAGAYVMLPRERDTNRNEVIVDNDLNEGGGIYSQPYYKEMTGDKPWTTGELEGFIYDLPDFRDTENPFENGTYRQTTTTRNGKPSVAAWYADIPADGEYAVYVSYKSLPNSTEDARYTVNYSGGSQEFRVNQTMGGGTWIYLGTFPLEKGYSDSEPIVTLTNLSDKADDLVVTADAVKIGGGMGNIARSRNRADIYYDPSTPEPDPTLSTSSKEEVTEENGEESEEGSEETEETEESEETAEEQQAKTEPETPVAERPKGTPPTFRTSGMPRFVEGARYWLHWAGFPEYVYSPYHGEDDYKDDYTSRGNWVNYLAGGSRVLPNREGMNIPVDVTFALHSDAGKKNDDSFIGTLGIYFTQNGDIYRDGTPRINSRMLTDLIMRQISSDIRQQYEPRWVRRSMWDKTYVEARVPEVPTTLIELMSHQNFADMMYGLDPGFRFTVGRAIYKGIARFMAERKDRELVIQPLPIKDFAIKRLKKSHYRLSWQPTPDPLEPTAMPDKYVIMERTEGELGFHKIAETTETHYELKVSDNRIHSFRVIALNSGGESFPSETLAMREGAAESHPVLIVNGFTRISGPDHFVEGDKAGFRAEVDFGVPYIKDISYTGPQMEFNRNAGNGFGRSSGSYTTQVIAGNTFDYPAVHGKSIAKTGRGFVSASLGAVESGDVKLTDYKTVDLILGKQKSTVVGNGKNGVQYRTFPETLQKELRQFSDRGGDLIISGQYVVSDLFSMRSGAADREFAEVVLGIVPADSVPAPSRSGRLRASDGRTIDYSANLNENIYIVENPDVLAPARGGNAKEFLTFSDSATPAGYIVDRGKSKVAVMSVPLEAISDQASRDRLIAEILSKL